MSQQDVAMTGAPSSTSEENQDNIGNSHQPASMRNGEGNGENPGQSDTPGPQETNADKQETPQKEPTKTVQPEPQGANADKQVNTQKEPIGPVKLEPQDADMSDFDQVPGINRPGPSNKEPYVGRATTEALEPGPIVIEDDSDIPYEEITIRRDPDTGERNVKGKILCVWSFRGYVLVSLPSLKPETPHLLRGVLVRGADYPLEKSRFVRQRGLTMSQNGIFLADCEWNKIDCIISGVSFDNKHVIMLVKRPGDDGWGLVSRSILESRFTKGRSELMFHIQRENVGQKDIPKRLVKDSIINDEEAREYRDQHLETSARNQPSQ
jgi:hypothetical protein